jgi:hypothetical protein
MTPADVSSDLTALIAEWRAAGLRACPEAKQPRDGWSSLDMASRPVGAALLQCADDLEALLHAPTTEEAAIRAIPLPSLSSWLPLDPENLPEHRVLVTNNLKAVDRFGVMSHVWIGCPIKASEPEKTGAVVIFDDDWVKVHNLTHYRELPTAGTASPTGATPPPLMNGVDSAKIPNVRGPLDRSLPTTKQGDASAPTTEETRIACLRCSEVAGVVNDPMRHISHAVGEMCPRDAGSDSTSDSAPPLRCPRCDSPAPHLHPAVQSEGEVQRCPHPYHSTPTNQNRVAAPTTSDSAPPQPERCAITGNLCGTDTYSKHHGPCQCEPCRRTWTAPTTGEQDQPKRESRSQHGDGPVSSSIPADRTTELQSAGAGSIPADSLPLPVDATGEQDNSTPEPSQAAPANLVDGRALDAKAREERGSGESPAPAPSLPVDAGALDLADCFESWRIIRARRWDAHDQKLVVTPFVDALIVEVKRLRAEKRFCVNCHRSWTSDESRTEYCGDCHRQFQALRAARPDSIDAGALDELTAKFSGLPENYATLIDHYREMTRRFAESRDELKHRCRALEGELEALRAARVPQPPAEKERSQ